MEYNFIMNPDKPPSTIGVPDGPDLKLKDFTPKMFLKDIGLAYQELGGLTWLVKEATANPSEFMKILQKIIPKQTQLDLMDGTSITLIDQFGQKMEITGHEDHTSKKGSSPVTGKALPPGDSTVTAAKSGQLGSGGVESATSGSPVPRKPVIIDVFPGKDIP